MEHYLLSKRVAGLGIEVLELKKCKWIFKLLNEEGVWQELLQNKYLKDKTISQATARPANSPSLKGLMYVKNDFSLENLLLLAMAPITYLDAIPIPL